jgi:hypothetical protein
MIYEVRRPIPVTTPLGDAYIWYITEQGQFENDIYTIVLCNNGAVRHIRSDQVKIWHNETFGIKKDEFKF